MAEKRDAVANDAEPFRDDVLPSSADTARSPKEPVQGPRYHAVVTGADGAKSLHGLRAYGDDEAIAHALALAEGRAIEIWDGPRLIEHFAAIAR